ncbi:MAG: NAD-dependent epimerase/dehydratase family protein, partial [Methylococcales bacterium]
MSIKAHIIALKGPILVTGASGFIGANLFKMLAVYRQDVYAVVRQNKGWRLTDIDDERIIVTDLNDSAATKNLINSIKPKTIFDFVAYGAYS